MPVSESSWLAARFFSSGGLVKFLEDAKFSCFQRRAEKPYSMSKQTENSE